MAARKSLLWGLPHWAVIRGTIKSRSGCGSIKNRQSPCSSFGVATGFDSALPRSRKYTLSHTIAASDRNSLCHLFKPVNLHDLTAVIASLTGRTG
jgi:hypothetical protein